MFDYLCVSASQENRFIEFVDHLHEHFIEPVHMRHGRYMPPLQPGYSIQMKPESLRNYQFPNGPVWQALAIGLSNRSRLRGFSAAYGST
jgi:L-fuconate dehydratase